LQTLNGIVTKRAHSMKCLY